MKKRVQNAPPSEQPYASYHTNSLSSANQHSSLRYLKADLPTRQSSLVSQDSLLQDKIRKSIDKYYRSYQHRGTPLRLNRRRSAAPNISAARDSQSQQQRTLLPRIKPANQSLEVADPGQLSKESVIIPHMAQQARSRQLTEIRRDKEVRLQFASARKGRNTSHAESHHGTSSSNNNKSVAMSTAGKGKTTERSVTSLKSRNRLDCVSEKTKVLR